MEIKDKIFLLRSKLINSSSNNVDRCTFERVFNVRYLHDTGHNATVYSKELDMHFQDKSAIASVYEIETVDFFVNASSRLSKSQEFIRRINYRYDWIQLKVNAKGKVFSVVNTDELKKRWTKLRAAIEKDYKGGVVEHALKKIDKQFEEPTSLDASISQYSNFGLIFPNIPEKSVHNMEHSRIIEFSDYENEQFQEDIIHTQTTEDLRSYELTGSTLPDSLTRMNKYTGNISIKENSIFPEEVNLKIEFERDNIINQWSFELLCYN